MPPWEKDESEFIQDVGVGNIEVVFESWYGDIAIELVKLELRVTPNKTLIILNAYILLHVFLTSCHRCLSHLEAHLSCRFSHEPSETRGKCATPTLSRGWLVWIAIVSGMRLLGSL